MGRVSQISTSNLSSEQIDIVHAKVMSACDRMCDGQVLELADALHDMLRARQRIRCEHARVSGGRRLGQPRAF